MKKFNVSIISQEKEVYTGEIVEITLPAGEGYMTILANHMPLISTISSGEIIIKDGKNEQYYAVGGGFIEVLDNKVNLLVDAALSLDELDEQTILQAKEEAEKKLAEYQKQQHEQTDIDIAGIESSLARSMAQLHLLCKRKK